MGASWAVRDRDILAQKYDVQDVFVTKSYYFNPKWKFNVLKADVVFCWFASFVFLPSVILAKILGKKVIIVSGGFDAAYAPVVDYGAFTKGCFSKWLRRKLFAMADKVLCVSKANMAETIINAQVPSEKCEMIYHGFEPMPEDFKMKPWGERKNRVVMISQCDHTTYYRKGSDMFLKLAEMMPDFEFVLVGKVHKDLEAFFNTQAPKNFRFTGFLPFRGEEFNSLLNDSKFIVQLSYYESFGCSVIDGSLMGCYPITTNQFSLFEVSEGIGTSVTYNDLNSLRQVIEEKANSDVDVQEISRKSLEKFSFDKRKDQILASVE